MESLNTTAQVQSAIQTQLQKVTDILEGPQAQVAIEFIKVNAKKAPGLAMKGLHYSAILLVALTAFLFLSGYMTGSILVKVVKAVIEYEKADPEDRKAYLLENELIVSDVKTLIADIMDSLTDLAKARSNTLTTDF